ncbi:hypothetical protein ACKGJO_06625 [Gracilimonas sp. Q87]|uniref:hypothetical protein n=1 Tax=Gracilimonas sp. Q87 TaxID=3384766 RepID=UPI003983EC5E
MNILILDPSKSATGWVVYDDIEETIIAYGTFKCEISKRQKKELKKTTERNAVEMYLYSRFLEDVCDRYQIEKVVSEQPHGSQSAKASWALSMVVSIITAFSVYKLGQAPTFYLESTCKKSFFDVRFVDKIQTREAMNEMWRSEGYKPETHHGKVVGYKDEAVSDALLVLTHHLHHA